LTSTLASTFIFGGPMREEVKIKKWEGEIPVHYLYTYGLAGEKFFREIKDHGKFVATKCSKCNVTYVPPRIYCECCFAELKDYIDVGTKGTVETYTICHESLEGGRLSKPEVIACVKIDNTDGGVVHRLLGIETSKIKIGMKVDAVFADPSKRTGNINDILGFRAV